MRARSGAGCTPGPRALLWRLLCGWARAVAATEARKVAGIEVGGLRRRQGQLGGYAAPASPAAEPAPLSRREALRAANR